MMPLAGPRSFTGPTSVLNGSLPKLLFRNSIMSCVPGVSAAMGSCTASLTIAPFMPTSSAFLCCQSKRSGKYAVGACAPLARCGFVGETTRVWARAGAMMTAARTTGSARLSMKSLLAIPQYSAPPLGHFMSLRCVAGFPFRAGSASRLNACDKCVLHLIGQLAVLDSALAEPRLEHIAGFFQHAARRGVPREWHGIDARETVRLDRVPRHRRERVGGDAASPERLREPVADFRGHTLDVGVQHEPDAADRFVVDRNREGRFRRALKHRPDEVARIAARVRMWKRVAEVDPDLAIVRVPRERFGVRGPPRSHDTGS